MVEVLSFTLQMVSARLRGKSAAIIDCCTPPLRLSFGAKPSLTTKHVVMILPRNFPAPHSTRLIAMLYWEARVGKRDSSLAIERITEKANRMPRVQARSAALPYVFLAASQSRSGPPGNLDAHSMPSASRLPPSCRPARVTPTAAVRSVGQTSVIAPS